MRVLFTTYPEKTHFMLLAPLAWALRTAGHEVRVAVQPRFVDTVTQAGLTAVPIGRDRDLWDTMGRVRELEVDDWLTLDGAGWPVPYGAAAKPAGEVTWEDLVDGYERNVTRWHKVSNMPMIGDLVMFARYWQPDLVIWEPVTFAGAVAAVACGAAHARLLIGTDVYAITRDHFRRLSAQQPEDTRKDPLGDWVAGYGRKYGLVDTDATREELIRGQFTIDLLPPSLHLQGKGHYESLRYTPYGGAAKVPAWLWRPPSRPRVALTMGLTINDRGTGYPIDVQETLDALADLDIEVVASIVEEEQAKLTEIPENAHLVSYVPLQALLPSCTAVIHHAGVGTLATAALNGLPHLCVPWDTDQPLIADRLAEMGAGLTIPASQATGSAIRESLLRLLTEPSFRTGAQRLQMEFQAQPSPNEFVPRLVALADEYRRVATNA
ncbi:activator-dependent family glycosyltransferase [Micromonospora sp. NPDC047793]|uniref:activator-dependent family glycosyltransferase n=1 Tax=unclassified Micromonospora TaxID=2617518 RepID=UPI0010334B41|nr:activator-dependent family glycosyltransferase [Verrucosispora sp. SN26_14.1]TBL45455.1 activator-dependent family glycosyltransferase [Verrucosispora sp. SN26_14.1]